MSFSTLQEFKDTLLNIALGKGLSPSKPIIISYNNADTNYEHVRFVVAVTEPHDLILPLNTVWLVRTAGSNFNKLMRRSSRIPRGIYKNTWNEVTVIENMFSSQIWDTPVSEHQELYDHLHTVGNPHLTPTSEGGGTGGTPGIGFDGGTLTGALFTRTLNSEEEYAAGEVVPRSWIDSALQRVFAVTEHIVQAFANINSQIDNLRTRVEILEASLLGVRGFLYSATEASQVWNIQHNLNNIDVMVNVYEGSEVVLPATIAVMDANNVRIDFAVPVAGRAELVPVVQYGQ